MPGTHGGKRGVIDKPKNMKLTTKRMLQDFKNERYLLLLVVLFSVISSVLTIIAPLVLADFLNSSLPSGSDATNPIILQNNPLFNFNMESGFLGIKWGYFFLNFGTLLGLYAGSAILSWAAEFIAVSVTTKYAYGFRDKIIKKIDLLPLSYFDRVPYGDTLSIGTNDVDNISRNLQSIITQLSSGISLFLGSLIAMFIYQWRLALVALCALPITLIIVMIISKGSQKQFIKYRKELGILNGKIEEDYSGFNIIKLFNKQKDVEDDFNKVNVAMSKADGLSQFLSGFIFPTTIFVNNVAYVAIAVIGGLIGQVGTMVAFFTLLNLFTRPFQQIGQIANIIQSVLASGERIYSLLDEVEESKDKEDAIDDEKDIVGQFDFEHVYFSYLIDKPLIEDFTLHVNPGDTVAIVGPTGAGKTTMVNLIMRFYDITNIANENDLNQKINNVITKVKNMYGETSSPTIDLSKGNTIQEKTAIARETLLNYLSLAKQNSTKVLSGDDAKIDNIFEEIIRNIFNNGNIRLDNKTIFNYTRKALRGSIGMVLQDTWLFRGTIKENLLYGDPNATDEEIENACKEAHIDHFIKTLPGGYNFMLTEDGENVSQGQRQLLTIARAIISKPKIMILDEATSSVDTRTEQQIQDALNRIMVGRTSFVIAHRLSTIKNAKLIIVMKKGHIIETGNHKELLAKNGFYAELYNSQFAGVNPMEKDSLDS